MAKLSNFETDINSLNRTYTKYMVSRIIDNPLNDLLEVELPTTIPEEFTVEMQFYSLSNNGLVRTIILTSSDTDVFTATKLSYADTSERTLLYVDFSKLSLVLDGQEGKFQVVLNFFIPEIGRYDEPILVLNTISPSRTEVELSLNRKYATEENVNILTNFATPQISSEWVLDAVKYICNQSIPENSQIPTDKTKISFDIISAFLPQTVQTQLSNPNISTEYTSSVKLSTQQLLDSTYAYATQSIQTYMNQDAIFTDTLIVNILSSSLSSAFINYQQKMEYKLS